MKQPIDFTKPSILNTQTYLTGTANFLNVTPTIDTASINSLLAWLPGFIFSVICRSSTEFFLNDRNKWSQFGDTWKGRLMKAITASFNTVMGQMTEMSQWKNKPSWLLRASEVRCYFFISVMVRSLVYAITVVLWSLQNTSNIGVTLQVVWPRAMYCFHYVVFPSCNCYRYSETVSKV